MPLTVTSVTTAAGVGLSFRGIAGGIFICLTFATVFYVMGFATEGWTIEGNSNYGLWRTCDCYDPRDADWFKAVQAMCIIGLIGLLAALLTVLLYMCVYPFYKYQILLALIIICFLTVVFMLIGFIIYGAKVSGVSWSFALALIGSILCLIAGILSVSHMRNSGLQLL